MSVWSDEPSFATFRPKNRFVLDKIDEANRIVKSRGSNNEIGFQLVDGADVQSFVNQYNRVLLTNNYILPSVLPETHYEKLPNSWYGVYVGDLPIESGNVIKNFNCFINRMDLFRQSWLYQLVRHDLFNQGFVSFNMDIAYVHNRQNKTPMELFEENYHQSMTIFAPEHEWVKKIIPYRNFDSNLSLNTVIMQSKFSIVIETLFDSKCTITFSEKIFRCLKLPRPWVVFSVTNGVKYLRDMGFDVLDDIVDHSYDSVEKDIDRQVKILVEVKNLCQLIITDKLQTRLNLAAKKNQQLLQVLSKDFYQDIVVAQKNIIEKCLNLSILKS
jgi:hypothetical protein